MVAVTGFKSEAPYSTATSPAKKAVVISMESDSDHDDDTTTSVLTHDDTKREDDKIKLNSRKPEPMKHGKKRRRSSSLQSSAFEELDQDTEHERRLPSRSQTHLKTSTMQLQQNGRKLNHAAKFYDDGEDTHPHRQPRIPWKWSDKKTSDLYISAVKGQWWSKSQSELRQLSMERQRYMSHIARIMETELGEELIGKDRCNNCQRQNRQCWTYSKKGKRQFTQPGVRCAACRFHDRDLQEPCSLNAR